MTTEDSKSIPHYDAERALSIAGGNPKIRDHITTGILDLFDKENELAALFDVSLYRRDPTRSRALTHRAIGLTKQGAMPALESICQKINTAIKSGKFTVAEELGRNLPTTIAAIRTAVSSARADVQHPG